METPEKKESVFKKKWMQSIIGIALAFIILGIFFVVHGQLSTVKIDNSSIAAPMITLGPTASGTLQQTYVQVGDSVLPNTPLARVGTEVITSQVAGLVVDIKKDIGSTYAPGQAVVTMIQPSELRVVGEIEENKGLEKLAVGQTATFTVDAFGSQKFYGVIDSIAPTSNASDVVFSISDKREEQIFDVKVRYDVSAYPELKNGMSAKLVINIK
jgi:multidrug resistance efflux pump